MVQVADPQMPSTDGVSTNPEISAVAEVPPTEPLSAELVVEHLDLARRLAHRYAGRGEPLEELVQVARLGLVQAAHRFDPERGSFASFAVPTILGELRRHFRDRCWAVQVPRPVRDLYAAVQQANEQLTRSSGRPPTVGELADELDVTREEILEAQESRQAYRALSLDRPVTSVGEDDDGPTLGESIGTVDDDFGFVDDRESVRALLPQVPARERRILYLRFYCDRTQSQIAEELGMSQMHVSRLLSQTLTKLRDAVEGDSNVIEWPPTRTVSKHRSGVRQQQQAS